MRRIALFLSVAAAVMLLALPVMADDDDELLVDIDPGECEVLAGGLKFEDEDANAHVIANKKFIIANCHVELDDDTIEALGGPFTDAEVFRDFVCLIENDDTAEDVPAFKSHAVLTPSGKFNVTCKAENLPEE